MCDRGRGRRRSHGRAGAARRGGAGHPARQGPGPGRAHRHPPPRRRPLRPRRAVPHRARPALRPARGRVGRRRGAAAVVRRGAWCAPGGMSALPRHLARGLDVRADVTARAVREREGRWTVEDAAGARWEADAVILTAPAPQSLALLDAGGVSLGPALRASLEGVRYHRCLAGMFDAPWPDALPAHGVAPAEDPLAWLACNRRKGVSPPSTPSPPTRHPRGARDTGNSPTTRCSIGDGRGAHGSTRRAPPARSLKRWRYARRRAVSLDGPAVSHGGALVVAGDAFAPGGGARRGRGARRSGPRRGRAGGGRARPRPVRAPRPRRGGR